MKDVPMNKKKSLGKLPAAVRNKMGFKKAGGKVTMMKDGGKVFKSHMMYDKKTGKGIKAPTMAKHLSLKKKGYSHRKPAKK